MGMTYEQFWEQDSWMVKDYRKAYEIRQEEQNRQAWIQGMYVYEAIADIAPILHAFAKKGTRARKYAAKPYEFKKPKKKGDELNEKDRKAKAMSDRIKARMMAGMNQINVSNAKKRIAEEKAKKAEAGMKLAGVDADRAETDAHAE